MKNTMKILSLLLVFILSLSLFSCSKKKASVENSTIELPTHLSEDPTSKPDGATESPTDTPTEDPTEEINTPSLEYKSLGNGTCSVAGIGNVSDLYVIIPEKSPSGDIVTTIEAGAFAQNGDITVVQIPSTVFSIGELAFADCESLVHISVDKSNAHFTDVDGVLFDNAQTTLICYPSAKASTSLLLPSSIVKISDMALYGCDSLKLIKYEGTVEQWDSIEIGVKNYGIYTASLSFSDKAS